jgi:hypothetical protein
MCDIHEVIAARKANLVSEVNALSKSKFFSIRALLYCLGFINASVERLDEESASDAFDSLSAATPLTPEWIIEKSSDLISENFSDFDVVEEHPYATRMINYLTSQLFIALMAELEDYLNQLLKLILLAYPEKLQSPNFDVASALGQTNAEEILEEKIDKKIMKKQYGPLRQFFNFIKTVLEEDSTINQLLIDRKIEDPKSRQEESEKLSLEALFPKYLEMKARRDIGIHNGWIRNKKYDDRVAGLDIANDQNTFLGVSSEYFIQANELAVDVVAKCNLLCKLGFVVTVPSDAVVESKKVVPVLSLLPNTLARGNRECSYLEL